MDTSGRSPAVIAIMNAHEPWQWMSALIFSAPVRSLTAWTAARHVQHRRIVERVPDRRQVDAGPPVEHPQVETLGQTFSRLSRRRVEEVGAGASPGDHQQRLPCGLIRGREVFEVQGAAVAGRELDGLEAVGESARSGPAR